MARSDPARTAGRGRWSVLPQAVDWLFRDRVSGRIVVAQRPNLSIAVFGACTVARWVADPAGDVRTALVAVGRLALVWWSVDELVRGVNPWRRILGGTVLAATVAGVALGR